MSKGLTVVFTFGGSGAALTTSVPTPPTETSELDVRSYADDGKILSAFAGERPQSILTFGDISRFPNLLAAPFYVRQRWLHFGEEPPPAEAGEAAFRCFVQAALAKRPDAPPLVSVITPAYKPGPRIMRPYRSLFAQTYPEWEWLIFDDSDDGGKTWRELNEIAKADYRVSVYRQHRHSGNIGELKGKLGHLASGSVILELDHDDELTPDALAMTVAAFQRFPEAGFAYSDWAEVFEDGRVASYGEGWAFGYGRSRVEAHGGRELVVNSAPELNPKTVRHIVSMPNHLRAWRRDYYQRTGGHNRMVHVADDFELCVRTFLETRMVHIPRLGYVQYYNESGNTQRARNQEIQRIVRHVASFYDEAIHRRLEELGVEDFCWRGGWSDMNVPNPPDTKRANLTYEP